MLPFNKYRYQQTDIWVPISFAKCRIPGTVILYGGFILAGNPLNDLNNPISYTHSSCKIIKAHDSIQGKRALRRGGVR